jgi:hypothetical protein
MNEKARKIVNETLGFLFPNGVTSLYFYSDFRGKKLEDNPFKNLNLDNSILECLNIMRYCESYDENAHYECREGANRSVIDVWRHLKYFNPDLTIFEVMNTVYKLIYYDNLINTFICGDIYRRVLIAGENEFYAHDYDIYDVFHLFLDEWKNI